MNFTGPFVLICGVIAGLIGLIAMALSMLYTSRHKGSLRNPFISTAGVSILAIFVSLFSLSICMLTFVQNGREIILMERDTDGLMQWIFASFNVGFILYLIRSLARSIAIFVRKENCSEQVQVTSEP